MRDMRPNPYPFPPKSRWTFAFPGKLGLFTSERAQVKKAFLRPAWAQDFEGWTINDFDDHH